MLGLILNSQFYLDILMTFFKMTKLLINNKIWHFIIQNKQRAGLRIAYSNGLVGVKIVLPQLGHTLQIVLNHNRGARLTISFITTGVNSCLFYYVQPEISYK